MGLPPAEPSTTAVWLGKELSALPNPRVAPTAAAASDALALAAIALALPMSRWRRQQLTGSLAWAGAQHRLGLPFLAPLHRWNPRVARPVDDHALAAGLLAAVLAALPWHGQGFVDLPFAGRPVVYFDGVARPRGAVAAAFCPPAAVWRLFLPAGADQQDAELAAGVLAVKLAVALGLVRPVIAGDSSSALGAMRKLSCGASLPGRAGMLQDLAIVLLRSGVTASLGYCAGAENPADAPSRAAGGWTLPWDCEALRQARARARSCAIWPSSFFRSS
jgi:hypothetical protein